MGRVRILAAGEIPLKHRHAIVGMLAALLLAAAGGARAHPLGNFTISHYAAIEVTGDGILLHYVIDMAEIPTFQEMNRNGITSEDAFRRSGYGQRMLRVLRRGLHLRLNGVELPLSTVASRITFPPGAGGLITMRIEGEFQATLDSRHLSARNEVQYIDTNFPEKLGWKEVVVYGNGPSVVTDSTVPRTDRSQRLSAYPPNMMNDPPHDLSARFTFTREPADSASRAQDSDRDRGGVRAGGATVGRESDHATARPVLPTRGASRWDLRFVELIQENATSGRVLALTAFLAMLLGAFHALEPGHGKTLVAAFLVGSRGTSKQALLLGLIVTASHTASVYALGGVTLYLSEYVVPERLYPWMALLSGLLIAGIGVGMLFHRIRNDTAGHSHRHAHPHSHSHAADHDAPHEDPQVEGESPGSGGTVSFRRLLVLGITGGLVPCPAALVVLLGAVALGRPAFGLALIMAFSVGLAAVLVGTGLMVVHAGRLLSCFREDSAAVVRWLPLASSAFIVLLGLVMAVRGATQVVIFSR